MYVLCMLCISYIVHFFQVNEGLPTAEEAYNFFTCSFEPNPEDATEKVSRKKQDKKKATQENSDEEDEVQEDAQADEEDQDESEQVKR